MLSAHGSLWNSGRVPLVNTHRGGHVDSSRWWLTFYLHIFIWVYVYTL